MARRETLPEPVTFGKYQLIERIAQGRMGEVFKAKRGGVEGFEKVLVVKKIFPHLSSSEIFVNTFVDEAKLTVSLSHANIVQVMDLGQQENCYFMAMEHCNGFDLGTVRRVLLSAGRAFPLDIAVFTISEVAKGLDYAHRRKDYNFESLNIVHRDLSPANVLISFEGEVKITDFGICRALEAVGTANDNIRRRYLYASPEQARGEHLTHRSDIFSLGLILYELVSGQHPYDDPDPRQIQRRAAEGAIIPIRQVVELPRALEQIINSSLVPDPNQRVDSAGTLYEELISYLFASGHKADNRSLSLFMQDMKLLEQEFSEKERAIRASYAPEAEELDVDGIIELDPDQLEMLESESDLFEMGKLQEGQSPSDKLRVGRHGAMADHPGMATNAEIPSARMQVNARQQASSRFDPVAQPDAMPGQLSKCADGLRAGRGGSMVLVGELGKGKDFLPDRLPARLKARGLFQILDMVLVDDDSTVPYRLATEIVRYVAGLDPSGRLATITAGRDANTETSALHRLAAYGLSQEEIDMAVNLCGLVDSYQKGFHAKRDLTLSAVSRLMEAVTSQNPFVLLLGGVEKLDPLSRDLLFHLVSLSRRLPIMIVVSTPHEHDVQQLVGTSVEGAPAFEEVEFQGRADAGGLDLNSLDVHATRLLTALLLADQPMPIGMLERVLGVGAEALQPMIDDLAGRGALRLVPPEHLYLGSEHLRVALLDRLGKRQLPDVEALASRLIELSTLAARSWLGPWNWTLMRLLTTVGAVGDAVEKALKYGEQLREDGWREVAMDHLGLTERYMARLGLSASQWRAPLLLAKARTALELMQIDAARGALEDVYKVLHHGRSEGLLIEARLLEAELAMLSGDAHTSMSLLRWSLDEASRRSDPRNTAQARLGLAHWLSTYGDLYLAQQHLECVLGAVDAWGYECLDPSEHTEALGLMVEVLAQRGRIAQAGTCLVALEQTAQSASSAMSACHVSLARAQVLRISGQPAEAVVEAESAYHLAREHNFIRLGLRLVLAVTMSALEASDADRARDYSAHLAELGQMYNHGRLQAMGSDLAALARVLTSTGDKALDALKALHDILARAQQSDDPREHLHAHHLLFVALTHLGSGRDAEHHRREALVQAQRCHADGLGVLFDQS